MALSKLALASSLLILSLLLVHFIEANQVMGINDNVAAERPLSPLPPTIDCDAACAGRCKLSKRPNLCKRSCGSCCSKCNCVPPGTSGNYEACPCYFNLTTHGTYRKCP